MNERGPDPARARLDARVLAWMREPQPHEDQDRFEALALELFAFQFARCEPYARLCQSRGRTPNSIRSWREIPAAPTGAFKEMTLCSFPAHRTLHRFLTSGTSTNRRGALHLDTLELYEASLLPTFCAYMLPDLAPTQRMTLRILAPAAEAAPESSLSHMFGVVLAARGAAGSAFDVTAGALRMEGLLAALRTAEEGGDPLCLAGTAFAFVHLCDELKHRDLHVKLPRGSRVMETGGFKGHSRELPREDLYAAIALRLGVGPERCVNQYGMTELGSQFYDSALRLPDTPRRKLGPPWARVRVLDPTTGEDAPTGEVGMLAVVDLSNTGSVLAVQTADLGRRVGEDGFEVLGRSAGAEQRGCSIAADQMLTGAP